MKELVIIGQGPAGISAALYAVRGGAKVRVVASGDGALAKASVIENYYGFPGGVEASKLLHDGIEQAKTLGVRFMPGEVLGISFEETGYAVKTTKNTVEAGAIILAVGAARNVPKIGNIETFEGSGVSYCAICDAFFFRGKKVGVIGSGAYAAEEYAVLKNLIEDVTLLTDGERPHFDLPCDTRKIDRLEGDAVLREVVFSDGTRQAFDGLFVACGSAGAFEFAKKLGLETQGSKIRTDENCATNIPGIYAAGDCTPGMQQIAKAVYDGMLAGIAATKYLKK